MFSVTYSPLWAYNLSIKLYYYTSHEAYNKKKMWICWFPLLDYKLLKEWESCLTQPCIPESLLGSWPSRHLVKFTQWMMKALRSKCNVSKSSLMSAQHTNLRLQDPPHLHHLCWLQIWSTGSCPLSTADWTNVLSQSPFPNQVSKDTVSPLLEVAKSYRTTMFGLVHRENWSSEKPNGEKSREANKSPFNPTKEGTREKRAVLYPVALWFLVSILVKQDPC